MDETQRPEAQPTGNGISRVGGWLRFLCIILVFLHPLNMLRSINFPAVETIQHEYPRAMTLALFDSVLVIALVVYSIYTGLRLWRVRPGAVENAKRFFMVSWLYFVLSSAALFTIGFPPEINAMLFKRSLIYVPLFSAIVLMWWLYLCRSRRVAGLYGSR